MSKTLYGKAPVKFVAAKLPYARPSIQTGALKVECDRPTNIPITDKIDWDWACRQCGIKGIVRKTDPIYPQVLETLRAAKGQPAVLPEPSPSQKLWSDCCDQLNVKYPRKGTDEHARVLELFKSRTSELPEDNDPRKQLWNEACAELGIEKTKKGTPEYEAVLELYIAKSKQMQSQPDELGVFSN